jgi:putative restriction endonuclease
VSIIMRQWILFTLSPSFLSVSSSMRQHAWLSDNLLALTMLLFPVKSASITVFQNLTTDEKCRARPQRRLSYGPFGIRKRPCSAIGRIIRAFLNLMGFIGRKWTREEHMLAFSLYSRIPFGSIHVRNPQIGQLAQFLARSVGSVSYKLANFARLDPTLQARGIRGMPHGARGESEIWREFAERPEELVFESELVRSRLLGKRVEEVADVDVRDLPPEGLERDAIVRLRVNQSFFRRRILSAYNYRCCITGFAVSSLLVASHIIPWSEGPPNRLNTRNGLCLNAIHDRAFDRGLMWIDQNFTVRFSNDLQSHRDTLTRWLVSYESAPLILPGRFQPDSSFLRRHAERSCKLRNNGSFTCKSSA